MNRTPEWTGAAGAPSGPAAPRPAAHHLQPAKSLAPEQGSMVPAGYTAVRLVGAGRHATVFLCREDETGSEVAVKLLHVAVEEERPRLAAHSELLAAGAAARHPCSVPVLEAGVTSDHRPYVTQEFCPGGDAQSLLGTTGPFPAADVIAIGTRLALALHSSHRRGVLHLAVRPGNVLFDAAGDALLADHGIDRVLQRAAPGLGSVFDPLYAPREFFGWEKPGPAADVYSLGATLYALLNGAPAHAEAARAGGAELYEAVLRGEVPHPARPDAPEALLTLVSRMMSVNPEGRPPLTEIHRTLRLLLPDTHSSRVPALEPEPAPVLPLPGWDPADEDEQVTDTGAESARREARRQARIRLIAACTALVVFAGAATALTLLLGHGDKHPAASPTASPSTAVPRPVPTDQLPVLMPRHVTVTRADGQVQVTWQLPEQAQRISGYVVQAKVRGTQSSPRRTAGNADPVATFPANSVSPGTCYTVTSLILTNGIVEYASAPDMCHTGTA
ncbi:serine/threonine protein kinase [Streptomyces sp. NBC_00433]